MKFKPGDKVIYIGEQSWKEVGLATNIVYRYDRYNVPLHVQMKNERWSNGYLGIGGVYEENIDLCPIQTLLSPEL